MGSTYLVQTAHSCRAASMGSVSLECLAERWAWSRSWWQTMCAPPIFPLQRQTIDPQVSGKSVTVAQSWPSLRMALCHQYCLTDSHPIPPRLWPTVSSSGALARCWPLWLNPNSTRPSKCGVLTGWPETSVSGHAGRPLFRPHLPLCVSWDNFLINLCPESPSQSPLPGNLI